MADAGDSKSPDSNIMRVQVPPSAPVEFACNPLLIKGLQVFYLIFVISYKVKIWENFWYQSWYPNFINFIIVFTL